MDTVCIYVYYVSRTKDRTQYWWMKKHYEPPQQEVNLLNLLVKQVKPTNPTGLTDTPAMYCYRLVTKEMLQLIVEHTNQYSVQKKGKSINTNVKEIEQVLGMYFNMVLVEMNAVRMYWEKETRYPQLLIS